MVNAMFWVNAMDVILTQVPSICVVQASAAEAAGRGITVTVMGIYPWGDGDVRQDSDGEPQAFKTEIPWALTTLHMEG